MNTQASMMKQTVAQWDALIRQLSHITKNFPPTLSEVVVQEHGKNAYLILISCLLSLRAKDTTTIPICRTLFQHAPTPHELLALPRAELERIIYKTGFYRRKAATLIAVTETLLAQHGGSVPRSYDALRALPGVGEKTANLVLACAFDIPALCVDTHVHRISNLWGLVHTRTPEQTHTALRLIVPEQHWIILNTLLVKLGQNTSRATITEFWEKYTSCDTLPT